MKKFTICSKKKCMTLTALKKIVKKFGPKKSAQTSNSNEGKVRYDFLFDYKNYNIGGMEFLNEEAALEHYDTIGYQTGASPSPFLNPELLQRIYADLVPQNLLYVEFGDKSPTPHLFGPLFNLKYFSLKQKCDADDAIYLFLTRLQQGSWCDFHPLICEEDFLQSGAADLYQWVADLFNPNQSLAKARFVFFLPEFYRRTCSELTYENELIDYLLFSQFHGGWPHPLCDLRFAALHGSLPSSPLEYGDVWSDAIAAWPNSAPVMSPFFDAYDYNHRANEYSRSLPASASHKLGTSEDVSPAKSSHPLIRFTRSNIETELGPQTLQNCLKYASGLYPVTALNTRIMGSDLIDIIGYFLTSSSSTPIDIKTSICILNYNKVAHTFFSAIAAAKHSDEHTEIIVFDNGSDSWQAELLLGLFKNHRKIRLVRSNANLFFGEGNNVAKDLAVGEYLYFLNNDAYVGPGTVERLVSHLDATPDAAACGVPFLFPDGTVQEYGGAIMGSGQQIQDYKNTPLRDHMRYAPVQGVVQTDYVSSASFCVRRAILEDVGGYDYIFEPLYFEDTDLCMRIRAAGHHIDLLYDNYVIHVENATTRDFLGSNFMTQIARNRDVFRRRWQYKPKLCKPRSFAPFKSAFMQQYPDRPSAVIYTPYPVSIGGGERYILSILSILSKTYNVTLVTERLLSRDRLAFVMSDLGLTLSEDSSVSIKTLNSLNSLTQPDLMIVMGNELAPPIRLFGKRNIYHCQFPFSSHFQDNFQFDGIDNIDFYMCNSQFTKRNVERKLTEIHKESKVQVLSPPVRVLPAGAKDFSGFHLKPKLISVGRFERGGHSKNQHVAALILKEIQKTSVDAQLALVGGFNGTSEQAAYLELIREIAKDAVITTNAPRADLEQYLSDAHLYIHACGYGSSLTAVPERQEHFGISIVEAMSYGCIPIVYNAGGPKEIIEETGCGFAYDSIAECSAVVRKLQRMPLSQLEDLSQRAIAAAARYSDEKFCENLLDLL